jgi:hypothetical protein
MNWVLTELVLCLILMTMKLVMDSLELLMELLLHLDLPLRGYEFLH